MSSSGNRLLDAWRECSEDERTAFLAAIGEDIDLSQQATLRRAYYEGTEKALKAILRIYERQQIEDGGYDEGQLTQKTDEFWEREIRWLDSVIEKLRAQNEPNCSDAIGNVEHQDFAGLDRIIQEELWTCLDQQRSLSKPKSLNATKPSRS